MKKVLLTTIAVGSTFAAFGQGQVVFENFNTSSTVNYGSPGSIQPAPLGNPGFTVALLWFNGTSFQVIDIFQSSVANAGNLPGYFNAGAVNVPTFAATGTFRVEGWYNTAGNYASYAAAVAAPTGFTYLGVTASFTAAEAQSPTPPLPVSNGSPGGWSGGLDLVTVPEPGTIALGALGGALLFLFRRRK